MRVEVVGNGLAFLLCWSIFDEERGVCIMFWMIGANIIKECFVTSPMLGVIFVCSRGREDVLKSNMDGGIPFAESRFK